MTCEALGVPYSSAKSAEDLTDADRYVALVIGEARRLYHESEGKKR